MRDEVWMSKNGPIKVKDMSLEHVRNALAHLDRHGIGVSNKAAYDVMQRRVIAVEEFKREAKGAGARIIDSQRLTAQCWVAETVVLVAHLPDFSNGVWVAESAERHHANHNLDDLLAEIEAEVLAGRAVQALRDRARAVQALCDRVEQHAAGFAVTHTEFMVTQTNPFEYSLKGEFLSYVAKFDPVAGWVVAGDFDLEGKGDTLIDAYNDAVFKPEPEQSPQSVWLEGLPKSVIVQYPDTLPNSVAHSANHGIRKWLDGDLQVLDLPFDTKITPVYDDPA